MKSNTLRGDEQLQKNAIRSLREYVDTAKQKWRQLKEKEDASSSSKSQLSSGSETTLGEGDSLATGGKLFRQLSGATEATTEGPEGAERSEHTTIGSAYSSKPVSEKGNLFKSEDSSSSTGNRPGEMTAPITPLSMTNRTYSEVTTAPSSQSTSVQSVEPPSKALTAPPSGTHPHNGSPAPNEVDDRGSKVKPLQGSKTPSVGTNSEASGPSGLDHKTGMSGLGESSQGGGGGGGLTPEDSSSTSGGTSTHVSGGEVCATPSGHVVGLETTSSAPSLLQDQQQSSHEKAAEPRQNGKKKSSRGKQKLRLDFQEMNSDNVVKCTLITSGGQQVDFRFSTKYDKPGVIFKKFVSVL